MCSVYFITGLSQAKESENAEERFRVIMAESITESMTPNHRLKNPRNTDRVNTKNRNLRPGISLSNVVENQTQILETSQRKK